MPVNSGALLNWDLSILNYAALALLGLIKYVIAGTAIRMSAIVIITSGVEVNAERLVNNVTNLWQDIDLY